ncbi:hypothetical protein CNYM01_13850 [Colletotrichum nymphaeae SA-01]|uniref:PD-(D/E)XK nuclease-like domain-containing protein n=1 Tax=Colletotrichum nymphaeae SA-01 TaxID=1460502 RepID=A0A135UU88_9PEZI|nr:hypothetical protein CNYM01_13850 [Colletotrichum nymphaeae SA-01]
MWDSIASWTRSLTHVHTHDYHCDGDGNCDDDRILSHESAQERDHAHIYDPEHDPEHSVTTLSHGQAPHKLLGDFQRRPFRKRKRQQHDLEPPHPFYPNRSHGVVSIDHLYTDPHETYLLSLSELREMDSSSSATPSRKRRVTRLTGGASEGDTSDEFVRDYDHDETPRPAHSVQVASYRNSPRSSPTKSSTASYRSDSVSGRSTSSARIKLVKLPLGNEGIIKRQFSGPPTNPDHPIATQHMLSRIRSLERCRNVLSSSSRHLSSFEAFMQDFDLDDGVFAPDKQPASRLTPADAQNIANNAKRCFEMDHDEPVWNAEVHNLLLTKVLRGRDPSKQGTNLCDFSLCTTASIIKEYVPAGAPPKQIDFCIYLNPTVDVTSKVLALRHILPSASLNHTSYGALCPHPISVGLETKRPGHDLDGAVLQIGVWQAAHWKMLRCELRRTAPERLMQQGVLSPTVDDVERNVQLALSELGALHGVLLLGHDWIYVATSPEPSESTQPPDSLDQSGRLVSSRTILWIGKRFGDTNSALGIHQIAAFLECLASWSSQTYWPWYRKWIVASP